ncbi:MAG: DUF502 domain-containing protein [Phenylobacterium sp.]|jgi:uncharacterized membrane protein|uniref:DUF502 domain-containing protein n=1 Tax=Phenylobacterium sp. TaxID=1871053 RepID=UPI003919C28B
MTLARLLEFARRVPRLVGVGALALAPLVVTLWLAWLALRAMASVGAVLSAPARGILHTGFGGGWGDVALNVLVAVVVLTLVGLAAESLLGKVVGQMSARLIGRVPVASTVYLAVQKLLAGFRSTGEDTRKVVLIEFPSPEMKTIGLVTRRFRASDTGEELAAVYVPTTPNPSSGYIEIVPVDNLVWLDWSARDAIQFIMSGGVIGPDQIVYGIKRPPPPI